MIAEPLIFVGTSDLSGLVRGKSFPLTQLDKRLTRGVGWVPTNVMITCFDTIGDGPYGSLGDLLIVPNSDTQVHVDFQDGSTPENFVLGDILTLEGDPWECCTRWLLKSALARLNEVADVRLISAFEHEFQFLPGSESHGSESHHSAPAFSLQGHRKKAAFGETLCAALQQAGIEPDSFINEYGADQYEVPIGIFEGIRAADAAVVLRQLVQATATRCNESVSLTPLRSPEGVGNGVHVHMSLVNPEGEPVAYEKDGKHQLSNLGGAFSAGILKYLPDFLCLTAPSDISYQRLTPHRWSAAYNNLGTQDREAALRICPVSSRAGNSVERQFNVEFRAADAAASPYLVLAALVHAGTQGIIEKLQVPDATEEDLSLLDEQKLAQMSIQRLPTSLAVALQRFTASDMTTQWFGCRFKEVYVAHKLAEIAYLDGLDIEEKCLAYAQVY